MERLSPPPLVTPYVAPASGGVSKIAYGLMGLMLFGGAWVRFNPQIDSVAPALAAPAAAVSNEIVDANRIKALLELALVPTGAAEKAVAGMSLPAGQARQLIDALRRGRLRLVRMPLLDLSPAASTAGSGRAVSVSSGGYTRLLTLTRLPAVVTLPVGPVSTVSFRTASADGIGIGTVSLTGLVRLPELQAGARLDVGIIAQ